MVYDRLVSDDVMRMVPAGVSRIFAGKETGNHPVPQHEINDTLVRLARAGRKVVRLKGGDPFVFGRGAEEALYLAERGIDFEIVPGITSATACTSYAGIPLTHRDYAQSVIFITGHGRKGKLLEKEIARQYGGNRNATLVVFMGVGRLRQIMAALIEGGMSRDTPVALIERGTTADQRRVLTAVGRASIDAVEAELAAPALIVIGKVVELAGRLDWFVPAPRYDEECAQSGS